MLIQLSNNLSFEQETYLTFFLIDVSFYERCLFRDINVNRNGFEYFSINSMGNPLLLNLKYSLGD